MKKLIIGMVALTAILSSQAAGYKWQSSGTTAGVIWDGTDESTLYETAGETTLYLFMAETISQADLFTALKGGQDISTKGAVQTTALDASNSKITALSFDNNPSSGTHDFYFATVFENAEGKDAFYISDLLQNKIYKGTGSTALSFSPRDSSQTTLDVDKGYQGAGVYAAVPEPFSGTLALLGLGAVALRRKMKKAKKA